MEEGTKKETDPLLPTKAPAVDAVPLSISDSGSGAEKGKVGGGDDSSDNDDAEIPYCRRLGDVLAGTWSLGLTAFGDSSAQVAIIQDHVCAQRGWMSNETFMELFSLSSALPGDCATQLVVASSMLHGGALGGLLALVVWVTPGAVVLAVLGLFIEAYRSESLPVMLLGIPPATTALVFKAAYSFGSGLDRFSFGLAMLSCTCAVLINGDERIKPTASTYAYPIMLACGGILTLADATLLSSPIGSYRPAQSAEDDLFRRRISIPLWAGAIVMQFWLILLLASILLVTVLEEHNPDLALFESFFRIGSVTFGGGEDAIAMLETETVSQGWLTRQQFLQGLGAAEALPGLLFNFAAFVGAVHSDDVPGALVSVLGAFAPAYLFMIVGISFWARLRHYYWFKALMGGVNAVAIGFMGAACVFLWELSVIKAADVMVFLFAGGMAMYYNMPSPIVILGAMVIGAILNELRLGQVVYNT